MHHHWKRQVGGGTEIIAQFDELKQKIIGIKEEVPDVNIKGAVYCLDQAKADTVKFKHKLNLATIGDALTRVTSSIALLNDKDPYIRYAGMAQAGALLTKAVPTRLAGVLGGIISAAGSIFHAFAQHGKKPTGGGTETFIKEILDKFLRKRAYNQMKDNLAGWAGVIQNDFAYLSGGFLKNTTPSDAEINTLIGRVRPFEPIVDFGKALALIKRAMQPKAGSHKLDQERVVEVLNATEAFAAAKQHHYMYLDSLIKYFDREDLCIPDGSKHLRKAWNSELDRDRAFINFLVNPPEEKVEEIQIAMYFTTAKYPAIATMAEKVGLSLTSIPHNLTTSTCYHIRDAASPGRYVWSGRSDNYIMDYTKGRCWVKYTLSCPAEVYRVLWRQYVLSASEISHIGPTRINKYRLRKFGDFFAIEDAGSPSWLWGYRLSYLYSSTPWDIRRNPLALGRYDRGLTLVKRTSAWFRLYDLHISFFKILETKGGNYVIGAKDYPGELVAAIKGAYRLYGTDEWKDAAGIFWNFEETTCP